MEDADAKRLCCKPGCRCPAEDGDEFCGEYCADAADGGPEYACRCGHPPCQG